ncbi:S8 family peptidase [Siminovitchia sediminis]|uniref:S8 family peptidase n=1 Tax=Siminovitchia sediminis TaxID=1274353 RepID=A0ABW4KLD7_9BACI
MFGYSMIQMVRRNGHKIDKGVRQQLLQTYHPFRKIPCIFHKPLEFFAKKIKRIPIIIEFEKDAFHLGMTDVTHTNCRTTFEFPSISCCSAKVTINQLEKLLDHSPHIKKVYYDRKVQALLDQATPSIRSDQLQESGVTGKDVTIAVIDTGIHPHTDLQGRIIGFKDFVNDRVEPYDDNGHGTHCAGDAAGNGSSSGGQYKGPAPEASVVGVKVLNKKGAGSLSTVIAGIEWCIQHQAQYNIKVLSLSLGSDATQSPESDPVVLAAEKAWDQGIVVCAAAGNAGSAQQTIASPGISPKIITVGAANDFNNADRSDDQVADFSSRGPTIAGDMKPDLVTPGVNIVSLRAPGSFLDKTNPGARVGSDYFSLSGTSMATPICAGVVAQLLQMEPELAPDKVKLRLLNACEDMGEPDYAQGRGYLNTANLRKGSS